MNGYPTELDIPPDTQDWNLDFNEKLIRNYKKDMKITQRSAPKSIFVGLECVV
jgi:hypothetical protein